MSQNSLKNSLRNGPNEKGYYGEFGSRYAPEILMPSLIELEKAFNSAINDKKFIEEFEFYLKEWVGRPNPLYFAEDGTRLNSSHVVISYDVFCVKKKKKNTA